MLRVEGFRSSYGRVPVLHDVAMNVAGGQIAALVGANGAGKTTLLRAISGLQPLTKGRLLFGGKDITACSAAERVALGVVQVPEGRQVFGPLTVRDNLVLGGYCRSDAEIAAAIESVFELFPVLRAREEAQAGSLSGGEQQMLAIGRALVSVPRLLLLDEPSLGLAPKMVAFIVERILELNAQGITVVIVEQNARMALEIADVGYVLETGHVTASGPGQALLETPAVQSALLGH